MLPLALLLAGAADPAPDYYPLAVGHAWHYRLELPDDRVLKVVARAVAEEAIDEVKLVRLETEADGKVLATEHVRKTAAGVFRHRYNGAKVVPPVRLLRLPVTPGDTWDADFAVGEEQAQMATEIGWAQVTVPAGKFPQALAVRGAGRAGGKLIVNTSFYAPGLGMVRQETITGGTGIIVGLEKFVPAK